MTASHLRSYIQDTGDHPQVYAMSVRVYVGCWSRLWQMDLVCVLGLSFARQAACFKDFGNWQLALSSSLQCPKPKICSLVVVFFFFSYFFFFILVCLSPGKRCCHEPRHLPLRHGIISPVSMCQVDMLSFSLQSQLTVIMRVILAVSAVVVVVAPLPWLWRNTLHVEKR